MQEDLIVRLLDFGLTTNQAKTYLSIIQSGLTSVNRIAKATRIHRQDIYKILPKLEEAGLITKTIDTPIMINAIPIEKALSHLVSMERKKANERIFRLEANLNDLINAIKKTQEVQHTREEEVFFLSTEKTIKHSLDQAYENARIKCDLVMNYELLRQRIDPLRWRFQKLALNKVRSRLLFEDPKKRGLIEKTLEEIIPSTGDFEVKLTDGKITVKPYLILDHKVFISTRKETSNGLPCILWTNSPDIIAIYEDNFEKAWNSHHAITIYPKRSRPKRELVTAQ